MTDLTDDQIDLLRWLGIEDFSQYGECHGAELDALIERGYAQVHEPGEHQVFIARPSLQQIVEGKDLMYRAVSLTEAGIEELRKLDKGTR